jgi:acetyl esterase/lipase
MKKSSISFLFLSLTLLSAFLLTSCEATGPIETDTHEPEPVRPVEAFLGDESDENLETIELDESAVPKTLRYVNVIFAEGHAGSLKLDIYPTENEGQNPVLVWIHGGGFVTGDKADKNMLAVVEEINAANYNVVSINYSLTSQGATYPGPLQDTQAALDWIQKNASDYNFDADNIAVLGTSAGAYFSSMLGVSDDSIQAAINMFGPTNFATLAQDREEDGIESKQPAGTGGGNAESAFIGCEIEDPSCQTIAKEASPITHVSSNDPAFLHIHGDIDSVIPLAQSLDFHEALQAAGVDSTLLIAEDRGHGGQLAIEYIEEIINFLDEHLK